VPTSIKDLMDAMDKRSKDALTKHDQQNTLAIGTIKAVTLSGAAVQMEASGRFLRNVSKIQGIELVLDARVLLARIGRQSWVIIGAIERDGATTATTANTVLIPQPQNLTISSEWRHCRLSWDASYQDVRTWEIQANTSASEGGSELIQVDDTQYLYFANAGTYYFRVRGVGPDWYRGSWTEWTEGEIEENLDMEDDAIINLWYALFDITPGAVSEVEGQVWWAEFEHTLNIATGWGPVLQTGHEIYVLVYNDTGLLIENGKCVYPISVYNGTVSIAKAIASSYPPLSIDLAITTMDIPYESYGLVTWFGKARGIDTRDFGGIGWELWVSPTVEGDMTHIKPIFPNYVMQIGAVATFAEDGSIFVDIKDRPVDTLQNFFNGIFRETFDFTVGTASDIVTGSLAPAGSNEDMTMIFSTGFSMYDTNPPATIVLTPGTDTIPQTNYVYIPESTKVLTVSTSDWPTTVEHIKVAEVVLRSAANTQFDGALRNQNWNDHLVSNDPLQGHLSHMAERIRQEPARWDTGIEGSVVINATPIPDDVYVKVTSGIIYQMHRQRFPLLDMTQYEIDAVSTGAGTFTISDDGDLSAVFPDGREIKVNDSTDNDGRYIIVSTAYGDPHFVITVLEAIPTAVVDGTIGDDIHIVNHFTDPFLTTINLNTQTDDATGTSLANASFSFVVWVIQNKTGQTSHLMLNLPVGTYAKNDPDAAVADASNYSVYTIPHAYNGVGALIARFTFVLQTGGLAWSLYSTQDLRGYTPNVAAGGGGGGGGASSFLGLSDTPSAYTGLALQLMQVNLGETALEATGTKTANYFYAGPATAPAAVPEFRAIIDSDIEDIPDIMWTQSHTFEAGLIANGTIKAVSDSYSGIISIANIDGVSGGQFRADKSRGSGASPSAALDNDFIFQLLGRAWDGTSTYRDVADMIFKAAGNTAPTSSPGEIVFRTTPDASITLVEAMRIDKDGFIGMGAVPSYKLDVTDTGVPQRLTRTSALTSSGAAAFILRHSTSANMVDGFGSNINFLIRDSAAVDNTICVISNVRDGADNSGRMQFFTNNAGSLAVRMTIKANGNVGIGTISPNATLDVRGSAIFNEDSADVDFRIESNNNTHIFFVDAGADRVKIKTASAGAPFEIEAPTHLFGFRESDGTVNKRYYTYTVVDDKMYMAARLDNGVLARALMTWMHDGNIGLATTTPASRLDIAAGAITFSEMSAPAAPAANGCVLYVDDNGAGKTRLMARFNTGAVQQVAIQP